MISIGIDVSKGKSTVSIMKPFGEILKVAYEVPHTLESLNELVKLIKSFKEEVRVIMEATGHYHMPVYCYLQENNIWVSIINPMLMKKYVSVTIRKAKTDKLDSYKIANYGLDYWNDLRKYQIESDVYYELKLLSRQYYQYMSLRIKAKITLLNLLDETMPGIDKLLSSKSNDLTKEKLVDFAKKYWHFDNIKNMSKNKFIDSYKKWTQKEGYRFAENKCLEIYALAQNSITTLPSKLPSTKMLVVEATKTFLEISKTLSLILSHMQSLAKSLPEYDVVNNMKGTGEKLTPRIIAEIGDITRFHSAKALVAYAGIDAPPYQSGLFTGTRRKISKRGSKYLRKTGYEIMKVLKTTKPTEDSVVYDYIIKKENEGKAKKQANIAGLNKFLRIYYARVTEIYNKKDAFG